MPTDTRGVFALIEVVDIALSDEWVNLADVWVSPSPSGTRVRFSDGASESPQATNTGYFGGGFPGPVSRMDKLTYSTDTTAFTPGANLSLVRYGLAATGSSTAGYFGGGFNSSLFVTYSRMDKLTYSTDTTVYTPGANLSLARYGLAATGSSTAGYFGGGFAPGPISYSTMDKVTYSSDTTAAVPGANLSASRNNFAATGNSTAGYFGGGFSGPLSSINKLTYSSDTTAAVPGANLSAARANLSATGNSTAGYFGGGNNNPGTYSTVDKVTYSTDTTAAVSGANLSVARGGLAATGNSTAGYFSGGNNPSVPATYSRMDKLTYATDTTAFTPGANLSAARYDLAASSSRANALPALDPPTFTPTPTTTPVPGLSSNTGYFGGGNPGPLSTMDKVTYSTDTTAAAPSGANLSVVRGGLAATGSSTAGYFGGGINPSPFSVYSTMDKLTYATDTTAYTPGANLSLARYGVAATGNSTAGYFGGGFTPSPVSDHSRMDKLTYSTDTTAFTPGANLSLARRNLAATGNSTAGYFGGGGGPFSTMDKLTYLTDTTAYTPGANLSAARYGLAATGSSTAGYFGGGINPSVPASYSRMDKLTYATDTTAFTPGANLSLARHSLSATGNSTDGYFGGGNDGIGPILRMDKLTYATDTTAYTPGANLSVVRSFFAASSARANALPSFLPAPNIV